MWDFSVLWMDEGKVWNVAEGYSWVKDHRRKGVTLGEIDKDAGWFIERRFCANQRWKELGVGGQFQICVDVCACVLLYRLQAFKTLETSHKNPGLHFSWRELAHPCPRSSNGRSWAAGPLAWRMTCPVGFNPHLSLLPRPGPGPSSIFPTWPLKAFGFAATVLNFHMGSLETETMFFILGSLAWCLADSQ